MRILILFLFLTAACAADAPPEMRTMKRVDDTTLTWYEYLPKTPRFPLVLLLQGSQCDRVYGHFTPFVEKFTAQGIGVICIEKRGMSPTVRTASEEFLRRNTVQDRVLDCVTVIARLRKTLPAWDRRIVLVGGSEGGMVAQMTAPLVPETCAVAVIASGEAMPMSELIPLQIAAEMRQSGAPQAKIDERMAQLRKEMKAIRENPTPWKQWLSDGKEAVNTWRWWDAVLDLRGVNALEQVDVPILIAQGADDFECPPENARLMEERFAQLGKRNLTLKRYPGVKHNMTTAAGARLIQETLEWIVERAFEKSSIPGNMPFTQ